MSKTGTIPFMLAGGQGSRLYELTRDECKPAIPFAGRRIVDWTLENVRRSGLGRLIVATQYRPHTLIHHLSGRWSGRIAGGIEVCHGPAVTGSLSGYLGTADAVGRNIDLVDALNPKEILVLAADHIYDMDYTPMIETHRRSGAKATVAVEIAPRQTATQFGVLDCDADGKIRRFLEKPKDPPGMAGDPEHTLVSMGIYVFDWAWLREVLRADAEDRESAHDFGKSIVPLAVDQGAAYSHSPADHTDGFYWRDVGTLDAYRAAHLDFVTPLTPFATADWGTGVRPRARIADDCVLLPGAHVARGARLAHAIVGQNARVPGDIHIGADPDEDRRWFRVTEGGTTLITQGMLDARAAAMPHRHFVSMPGQGAALAKGHH